MVTVKDWRVGKGVSEDTIDEMDVREEEGERVGVEVDDKRVGLGVDVKDFTPVLLLVELFVTMVVDGEEESVKGRDAFDEAEGEGLRVPPMTPAELVGKGGEGLGVEVEKIALDSVAPGDCDASRVCVGEPLLVPPPPLLALADALTKGVEVIVDGMEGTCSFEGIGVRVADSPGLEVPPPANGVEEEEVEGARGLEVGKKGDMVFMLVLVPPLPPPPPAAASKREGEGGEEGESVYESPGLNLFKLFYPSPFYLSLPPMPARKQVHSQGLVTPTRRSKEAIPTDTFDEQTHPKVIIVLFQYFSPAQPAPNSFLTTTCHTTTCQTISHSPRRYFLV